MSSLTLPAIGPSRRAGADGTRPSSSENSRMTTERAPSEIAINRTSSVLQRTKMKQENNLAAVAIMALEKKKKALELVSNLGATTNILKDKAMYRTEREINLTHFRELMNTFQTASSGRKAMNMDEFTGAFRTVLGQGLSDEQMAQLFMKIDANTDGTVDWDEFCTFMLLRAERQSMMQEEATTTLFEVPPPMVPHPRLQTPHRDVVIKIFYHSTSRRYITCSREGTICYWSEALKLKRSFPLVGARTIVASDRRVKQRRRREDAASVSATAAAAGAGAEDGGGRWVHDMAVLVNANKIAVASDDHEITFFDFPTMEFQACIDLQDTNALSIDIWCDPENPDSEESMLLYGTDQGHVVVYKFRNHEMFNSTNLKTSEHLLNIGNPSSSSSSTTHGRGATIMKRKAHGDWTVRVRYYHDIHCVVSCSPDPQDSLFVATEVAKDTWTYFSAPVNRGINCFGYCRFPVCLITGGTDRQLRLWNPHRLSHPTAALKGHNAPIFDITVNEVNGQIISLSADRVIKVWDIRKQSCVQTLFDNVPLRPDETLSTLHFNPSVNGMLIAAASTLTPYHLKGQAPSSMSYQTIRSHDFPIRAALYNSNFRQVVSGCDGGVVNVWDILTGQKTFRFSECHGKSEITAMAFDPGFRRLLTGGRDGTITMWNFNNGQMLRKFVSGDTSEVSGLTYVDAKDRQYIISAACDRKITVFLDDADSFEIRPNYSYPSDPNTAVGWHKDDIISMAFCKPNLLVTGSYDGEAIITNFQTGHIIHYLKWPGPVDPENSNRSVDKILFLPERVKNPSAASLLTTGSDGYIRWWNPSSGELYWEFNATLGRGEEVVSLCTNETNSILVVGDAAGYIIVYDISLTCCDDRETITSPEVVSSFRGHLKGIVSVEFTPGGFLLTGSTDGIARMFTMNGDFVGSFGQEAQWDLTDPNTYAHPLKPPEIETLLAHEKLMSRKFQDVTHKVVLSLRSSVAEDQDEDDDESLLPPINAKRSLSTLSRAPSMGSSLNLFRAASISALDARRKDEDRPIQTAEILRHGYHTWYGSTQFAKDFHRKILPKVKPPPRFLPRLDNPNRTFHNLIPHELDEILDVKAVPVLASLAARGGKPSWEVNHAAVETAKKLQPSTTARKAHTTSLETANSLEAILNKLGSTLNLH